MCVCVCAHHDDVTDVNDDVIRLKKPMQRKKYGLLLSDSVEMEAVDSDEDDTLFEARSLNRSEVKGPAPQQGITLSRV